MIDASKSLSDEALRDIRFELRSKGLSGGEDQEEFNAIARAVIAADRASQASATPDGWLTLDADPDTGMTGELTFERVNGESIPLYRREAKS